VIQLEIPSHAYSILKFIVEKSAMDKRTFVRGFAISLIALILMGMAYVAIGNTIPNLNVENTPFFLVAGLIGGTIGGVIVTLPEVLDDIL
jgi:hypothetical protein